MSYPVTLVGGTDELRLVPDGQTYYPGDRIDGMTDAQRVSLQASGLRFAAIHEEAPAEEDDAPAEKPAAATVAGGPPSAHAEIVAPDMSALRAPSKKGTDA